MTTSYDVDAYVVELRARVRELEASRREDVAQAGRFLARAEKAEGELRFACQIGDKLQDKLKASEARVAELEDALKACIDETPAMWAREKEEC